MNPDPVRLHSGGLQIAEARYDEDKGEWFLHRYNLDGSNEQVSVENYDSRTDAIRAYNASEVEWRAAP